MVALEKHAQHIYFHILFLHTSQSGSELLE